MAGETKTEEVDSRVCDVCFAEDALPVEREVCACGTAICAGCAKRWFTSIVDAGFDGACPKMRCPSCPLVVPQTVWKPLVDTEKLELFKRRAKILLSLQCGSCHCRRDVAVVPTAEQAAAAKAWVAGKEGLNTEAFAEDLQEFLLDKVPTHVYYEALRTKYLAEEIGHAPAEAAAHANTAWDAMKKLLESIDDAERRANLHLRHLTFYPKVVTTCCSRTHCFKCRIKDFHENQTCEQYQANRGTDDLTTCPACGIYVTKGDGCNSITCVCGRGFSWSTRVNEMRAVAVDAFLTAHAGPEGDEETAYVLAARAMHRPEDFDDDTTGGARAVVAARPAEARRARATLWQQLHPHHTVARTALLVRTGADMREEDRALMQAFAEERADDMTAWRLECERLRAHQWQTMYGEDADVMAILARDGVLTLESTEQQAAQQAYLAQLSTSGHLSTVEATALRTLGKKWLYLNNFDEEKAIREAVVASDLASQVTLQPDAFRWRALAGFIIAQTDAVEKARQTLTEAGIARLMFERICTTTGRDAAAVALTLTGRLTTDPALVLPRALPSDSALRARAEEVLAEPANAERVATLQAAETAKYQEYFEEDDWLLHVNLEVEGEEECGCG